MPYRRSAPLHTPNLLTGWFNYLLMALGGSSRNLRCNQATAHIAARLRRVASERAGWCTKVCTRLEVSTRLTDVIEREEVRHAGPVVDIVLSSRDDRLQTL